jgi:hypothetical protein
MLTKPKTVFLLFCLLAAGSFCHAAPKLDKSRYITIDEIQPGMKAYCLTAYKGTEIEKFDLEVLDVVRDIMPGRDAILVQGTDERFIHTGPVSGCSGSPVYIEGRLAGALAFGWTFSKDPLYGVTPIEEMLSVGEVSDSGQNAEPAGFAFDFSRPLDFAEFDKQLTNFGYATAGANRQSASPLPCPLITSGLPPVVCEQLNYMVEPFGLVAVAGIGAGSTNHEPQTTELVPGASLAVPLVTGDITMTVIGTVTEVEGNDIYAFGHSFLGYGPIDLPMATGKVHTVVSNLYRSFKFASALETIGALRTDEAAAVRGRIGAKARMIPLKISINRYNDTEKRIYNCQIADNQLLTPVVLRAVVAGAALYLGNLPPDHMVEYKVNIETEGAGAVSFENISTSQGLDELVIEGTAPVAILLNNPYEKVDIKAIDFNIRILPKNIVSHIWSVDLSDSKVKPGQTIEAEVIVESVLADKQKYRCSLKIPDDLPPDNYDLVFTGGYGYAELLKKSASYKFIPQNLATLIEAMNNLLRIKRDKLYCLLVMPPGGVTVASAELPDLPATRALVLADAKRALKTQPYKGWLEQSLETGTVIIDNKVMTITVEK